MKGTYKFFPESDKKDTFAVLCPLESNRFTIYEDYSFAELVNMFKTEQEVFIFSYTIDNSIGRLICRKAKNRKSFFTV